MKLPRHGRASLILCLLALGSLSAPAAAPRRVLVVHSFGIASPPFTTHSTAFEKTLTEELGERVDLDEVSLDMARYADPNMQEAMVEYLQKRYSRWKPDLVVPIGSPAGVFTAQYRTRLFPRTTPIIYAGMDQRRLPAGALQHNAAFVGEAFNFPGMIEDILQVAPATTNIAVVIGASQLERYWTDAIRQEWAPFTNRLGFTWLNELSFDQMLERVSHLPPRSFIFLILLMRDAAGVTRDADEALRGIHAVANAPVNSIYQHQLGLGIVGGRLYQAELEGVESARIAVRLLRGQSATQFPPEIIGPLGPRYDWRELHRWGIGQNMLPPRSAVLFRELTTWERYRWRILGAAFFVLLQSVLIVLLLRNLLYRRSVERALRESEERLHLAAAAGDVGVWMWDVAEDLIWATDNWRSMFGFSPEAIIRYDTFLQRVHKDDRPAVELAVKRAVNQKAEYSSEHRVSLPNGAVRWITANGRVHPGAGPNHLRMLGASVDITERKRMEHAARELSGRLISAQEEERARLAKELHDGLNQSLALMSVDMDMLGQRLPAEPGLINARLKEFSENARGLSAEVHRISHGLHPAKLEQLGLVVALRSICAEVEGVHGVTVSFENRDIPRVLPDDVALCLYRVAQEAIQNVVKHSGAKKASVELVLVGHTIHLKVRDDGLGFEVEAEHVASSLGLVSMRERVRLVHGGISVDSEPCKGTCITAFVPISDESSTRPTGNVPLPAAQNQKGDFREDALR